MTKTNNNEITINETLLNDSKIVVGKWKERVTTETNRKNRQFKSDLRDGGLWFLIGKLMNDLTEVHGSVSEDLAKKYGIHVVASKQRRHEAKKVFQNYDLATKILRKSKRGINSISYLFQQLDAEMNPKTVSKDTVERGIVLSQKVAKVKQEFEQLQADYKTNKIDDSVYAEEKAKLDERLKELNEKPKSGKKVLETIKSLKPNVPITKLEKAKSKLNIAIQKTKASKAKLKQTIFDIQQKKKKD